MTHTVLPRHPPATPSAAAPSPNQATPRPGGAVPATAEGGRSLYRQPAGADASITLYENPGDGEAGLAHAVDPGTLELCLNVMGHGAVQGRGARVEFQPLTAGFYVAGRDGLRAWREPAQTHQFITVKFSRRCLRPLLAAGEAALHPLVAAFARGNRRLADVAGTRPLTTEEHHLVGRLLHPPVSPAARPLWYRGKLLELMAGFFFQGVEEDEFLCQRQKRLARQRAERVVAILRQRPTAPPSLEELGREVGCSPFYLSRTFSRELGLTIPQYVRRFRMERAAALLQAGTHNVTEAAIEVGYNSLSHFTLAFRETFGCCPGLYPLKLPCRQAVNPPGNASPPRR